MPTILLLIFIFLSNTLLIKTEVDLCTFNSHIHEFPSTWSYSTVDQVKRCFDNISVNHSIIQETMKQLFNSLDFYSFLSIIRQSDFPYYTNIHLQQDLFTILHQTFKNDYDFHMNIVSSYKNLKDFHMQYRAPNGYAKFELLLPFILRFYPLTKQIKVQIGIQLYSSLNGNNLNMNYTNKIITKIDGINAMDYIEQFAEQQSLISKDKYVRLNSVFREEFWIRNLAQYPLPLKNNITFTFLDENETTITFPYLILITKKYANQIELENDNQFSPLTSYETRIVFNYIIENENLNWYQKRNKTNFDFMIGNHDTYYYHHKSTETAIIRLGSFNEEIFEDIYQIFSNITGKTLIIDLIGNQGGHSCLAYSLLNSLVPEYDSLRILYEPMDSRITKSFISFSKVFNLYSNSFFDLQTGLSCTNVCPLEPYVNYTRGHLMDEYSRKLSINCDGEIFGMGKFWLKNIMKNKYFKSIYALTDGTCGSACSLFLSKLKFGSNFKMIYGIGGGYYEENEKDFFESSSYAGGGAFRWNDIVQYHNLFNNENSSINYLPTSAFLSLNVYEIYINQLNSDIPREFLKQPIDVRLTDLDYFNTEQSLEKIINDDIQFNNQMALFHSSFLLVLLLASSVFIS